MKVPSSIVTGMGAIKRYHYKSVFIISLLWTIIDIIYWVRVMHLPVAARNDNTFLYLNNQAITLRVIIVFFMSCVMSYVLLFKLREKLRDYPLLLNLFIKTGVLMCFSFFMNFLLHVTYSIFILDLGVFKSLYHFYKDSLSTLWVFNHSMGWVVLFMITQLVIELNEKYSPGVFLDILLGRYLQPRVETRIIMFLDLTDSTPIAEKLGHITYFRFIREFIYFVSMAVLEYNGHIYQYVGDEVVVSWKYDKKNIQKCISSLVTARKYIQRNSNHFKRRYGFVPQFKVGVHVGEVTLGEIGVIKKDIAISGDTMNTAARIRTACTDLNHPFLASKEFADSMEKSWQSKSLGSIDLKGKSSSIELFALQI